MACFMASIRRGVECVSSGWEHKRGKKTIRERAWRITRGAESPTSRLGFTRLSQRIHRQCGVSLV